ncbi:MAG: TonB family protein, partial [Myxococcota bacterium]
MLRQLPNAKEHGVSSWVMMGKYTWYNGDRRAQEAYILVDQRSHSSQVGWWSLWVPKSWHLCILFSFLLHVAVGWLPLSMDIPKKVPKRAVRLSIQPSFHPSPSLQNAHLSRPRRPKAKPQRRRHVKHRRVRRQKHLRHRTIRRTQVRPKPRQVVLKKPRAQPPKPLLRRAQPPKPLLPKAVKPTFPPLQRPEMNAKQRKPMPEKVAKATPPRVRPLSPPDSKPQSSPALEAKSVNFGPYRRLLYRSILGKKSYPYMARRQRQEGQVVLLIQVSRRGELMVRPKVLRSSSYDLLDREAIRMVREAAPWPDMPEHFFGVGKRFRITVR